MAVSPSGSQQVLTRGAVRAVVVEVGGGLRTLEVDGVPVVDGYGEHERVTAARGLPLVPWPNRLHGGSYTWDGEAHPVPMDEPAKDNSLHGVCRFRNWVAAAKSEDAVTMTLRLHPSPPYPFSLDLAVTYSLQDDGVVVTTTATNVGASDAPYAQGAHPYVTVGGQLDDAMLHVPATSYLPTDEDQIPTGVAPVEGTPYDFRTPRTIGAVKVDYAFTELERAADGRAVLRLSAGERAVEVWVDQGYPYLEVFTGDTVPDEQRRRQGLGVEPMTAPPNAFVTGQDLLRLSPGETVSRSWGIRVPAPS